MSSRKKREWTTVRDGERYPYDSDPNQVDILELIQCDEPEKALKKMEKCRLSTDE